MTINIGAAEAIADGASLNFDQAIIATSQKGATATIGTRILVFIRVSLAMELRVLYATNGPDAVLTFLDRGTVDKLVPFADFQATFTGTGTNMRFTITNIGNAAGTVDFFSTLL